MQVEACRFQHLVAQLEKTATSRDIIAAIHKKSKVTGRDIAATTRHIDKMKEALLLREACRALDDVTFGARAGLAFRTSDSLTGYIAHHSRTLRAAIENSARYYELVDPSASYSLRLGGNSASFEVHRYDARFSKYHRLTEFLMFAALARMRAITQTDFFPMEMRFDHKMGKSAPAYQKLAGFPVVFGAETLEMILPLSVLDLPIPTFNLRLREYLSDYGERLLKQSTSRSVSLQARVEGLITNALPARMLTAEEVAATLGMSNSTFARKLRKAGTSYRAIIEELRSDLAQSFLREGMSLSEIAFTLGYADQAAFSTAFKRWTGRAPSRFSAAS